MATSPSNETGRARHKLLHWMFEADMLAPASNF